MPNGIGTTLTEKAGPLPVWAWTGLGVAGLAGYMIIRSKDNAAAAAAANNTQGVSDSSNLGTVPVSNLTTAAQPMPIQMGDTFVNVAPDNTSATATVNNPPAPAATGPNMTATPALMNQIIHTPLPGYTGISWSKLTPAARENLYVHDPAPGYSGIAWSQLPLATRVSTWVAALKKPVRK